MRHPAGSQYHDEGPEHAAPAIRIMVVVDFDPAQGECTIQSLSKHRACSHYLTAGSDEGGPTGALRALANAIDAEEDHYRGVPD